MSRTVVITGANRGIGLELAKHYHAQGDEVIGICRETSEELDELASMVIENVDVTNPDSLEQIKILLSTQSIDILINNAGLFCNETLPDMNFDTIQQQMEVNAYGPLRVTLALLPQLKEGSKIANITSRMGSIADNTSGAYYGYRASKAALNSFGKSLAEDLKPQGIAVAQLHPGFVQTRMVGFNGDITPDVAAKGLADRIEELNMENTGGFWHSNGEALPW
ncbi:SDR family oxidoreductase [Litoribrevibacter albus]|uniref:Short-chain dehydrogenase n=1 Tax=Litoribrevibacter albus TaxID=1473156 RepID=A0AA37S747_9GAMM|nr:SDR family oxidoreductase [Litoribrevibacter albus]GLQ30330.1 short-chain dehydrogenase [Litoribrevibacter albus]